MKLKRMLASILCIAMVLSTMSVSVFATDSLPDADAGVITLTEDIILSETLEISSDTTIDLNGFKITSADITEDEKAFSPLIKIEGASVVIKDSASEKGAVVPGTKTNVSSYNTTVQTIEINNGALTIDGAVIEGQKGVNTKFAGIAITAYLSDVKIINSSVISGGTAEKKDVTDDDQNYYNNEGNAGEGVVSYGSDIIIENSTINGGNGIATGDTITSSYISGGDNFANAGEAIELRGKNGTNSTLAATGSVFNGGDSDLYNPAAALSVQGSSAAELIDCVVTGGSVTVGCRNYGIGGNAVYLSGTPNVTIKESTIIAGEGLSSTKNGALEIASGSANPTVVVEDSTLDGGNYYAIGGSGKGGDFTLINSTIKGEELIESGTVSSITVEGTLTVADDSACKDINVDIYSTTGATISGADTAPEVTVLVAKIGDTKYASIQEALAAATGENCTITLFAGEHDIADLVLGSNVREYPYARNLKIVGDGEVTINLNSENKCYQNGAAYQYFLGGSWYTCGDSFAVENIDFVFEDTNTTDAMTMAELQVYANNTISFTDCAFNNVSVSPWGNNTTGKVAAAEIKNCKFNNIATRSAIHQSKALDLTVDGCTFTDVVSGIHISGNELESLEITGNTFTGIADDSSAIYFGNESWNGVWVGDYSDATITVTGNNVDKALVRNRNESLTLSHIAALADATNNTFGKAFTSNASDVVFVAKINDGVKGYTSFEAAVEDAVAGDTITFIGDITTTADDTYYLVPQVAGDNQATVTFDFGGGTNADGFISETFILNLGESINAPTGLIKDGYIFKGWDKNVPEKAYASETYIAQWILKDDYKFKTVLAPVGGIEVAENEIKIDPQGSFIVEVSIEDAIDDMAWNVTEVTLSYNKDLFAWNKLNNTVAEDSEGNLVFKVYGEDKVDGKVAKQLSFTAKENTDKTKTYEGEFNVVKASVDTGWAANTIDATLVDDENKGTAKVYIYYTFDVTVGDGVVAPSTADTITDYEGEIKEYNPEYNYDIIVDMDGKGEFNVDYNETTGEFTIDNADIVGDFTIDAVRTGIKGVTTDDVEIYEYVAGKYALVLLNADSARTYAYNGALMYKTPQYDTVAGKKVHFGYLVKETAFEIDSTGSLNTEANKALALSKITLASSTNPSIDKIEIVGDANGTGIVDVNDIQAVWNCYNVESNDGAGVNVNMPLYLRADICGANAAGRDKKVDVADLNAVIAMYDYASEGGTVEYVPTVFATCETDGTTYSIVCGETTIVATTPISAVAHNYVWTGIEGVGADVVSVETCTKCGDEIETEITDIIPDVKLNGDKIYGIVNIDSADDLIYINRLDAAGKLSHGEGRQPVININADIDLAGYEWRALNGHFVTINGNGNTISNINGVEGNSGKGGFIGYGGGCQINNLTLENISVEGCQVGAFFGGGEGGSVVDCTLKGNVNITWKQNYTSDYVEEYGAIGIISGLHAGGGEYKVTIDADTNIVIDDSAFTSTKITEVGYTRTDNDYIQYVQGSTLVTNIIDLRSNN